MIEIIVTLLFFVIETTAQAYVLPTRECVYILFIDCYYKLYFV